MHRRPIPGYAVAGFELERACCDPKDGELCLNRVKPEETLVEALNYSMVAARLQCWAIKLSVYMQFQSTPEYSNADGLSRLL